MRQTKFWVKKFLKQENRLSGKCSLKVGLSLPLSHPQCWLHFLPGVWPPPGSQPGLHSAGQSSLPKEVSNCCEVYSVSAAQWRTVQPSYFKLVSILSGCLSLFSTCLLWWGSVLTLSAMVKICAHLVCYGEVRYSPCQLWKRSVLTLSAMVRICTHLVC